MLKTTKYLLPLLGIFLLTVLATGCMKDELVDPCAQHEDPSYRNNESGGEEGNSGGGGISDGGDEESDSERNNKQTGSRP